MITFSPTKILKHVSPPLLLQALHGRHGRAAREVRVHRPTPSSGTVDWGLEVLGVSGLGVFVSELEPGGMASGCGLLQVGDQILEVNGQSTGDHMYS